MPSAAQAREEPQMTHPHPPSAPPSAGWRAALEAVAEGVVRLDAPMAKRSTFGIGGPAELWYEPVSAEALCRVLSECRRLEVPYQVVGGGSNLLVADRGLPGVVVRVTGALCPPRREGARGDRVGVRCSAGTPTAALRRFATAEGLIGSEFLIGIPGTMGGAIQMNAGTRLGEMVDVVYGAEVATPDGPRWLEAADFRFAYRYAELPPGAIVTELGLALRPAAAAEIEAVNAAAQAELRRRHATQPKGKSAGSIFKNPPGDYAGRLIEAAGLKGSRCGGAVVSELHANFIVNEGGATAAQVYTLIQRCRAEVEARFGVKLELEVRLLGEFDAE